MFGTAVKKLLRRKRNSHPLDLTILYGTHSGNSAFIAKEAKKYFQQHNVQVRKANMANYRPEDLAEEKCLAVIVSTQGEGEPPESANRFYRFLFDKHTPRLSQLRFSVCALGDSSYEHFCQTGKDMDRRLEELGARRFFNRVDCDVEFRRPAAGWIAGFLKSYQAEKNGKFDSGNPNLFAKVGKHVEATVLEKYCLNPGSSGEVYHVALSVDTRKFRYEPGDSISLLPRNSEISVGLVLQQMGAQETTTVIFEGKNELLIDLLRTRLELTRLSKAVLERYQSLIEDSGLEQLLSDKIALSDYLAGHDINDLFADFPSHAEPGTLITVFQELQPRLYSIASSRKKYPGKIHLTVKQVCYSKRGRERNGTCSDYLNRELKPGDQFDVQLVDNEFFRLPDHPGNPVIMIGAGTGVAPFRAFLQEREHRGGSTENWLIFGEKNQQHDFLYQRDWEELKKNKVLTRLNVAFSRDHAQRIYVQHLVREEGAGLWEWLSRGAHVYICGSVAMGHEVRQAFLEVIRKYDVRSEEPAESYLQELAAAGRWHVDVY